MDNVAGTASAVATPFLWRLAEQGQARMPARRYDPRRQLLVGPDGTPAVLAADAARWARIQTSTASGTRAPTPTRRRAALERLGENRQPLPPGGRRPEVLRALPGTVGQVFQRVGPRQSADADRLPSASDAGGQPTHAVAKQAINGILWTSTALAGAPHDVGPGPVATVWVATPRAPYCLELNGS